MGTVHCSCRLKRGTINPNRKKNTEPKLHEQTMNAIEKDCEQIKNGIFVCLEAVKKRFHL